MPWSPVCDVELYAGWRVRKWRLHNGLHALTLVDRSAPVISYQTWLAVGSRHERPGKTGLAHLFEHLMFNESAHLKAGEFDRLIEAAGGDTNAATWVDWTYYRDRIGAEHLELVARLEAERLGHLVLHEPQVASEREVVANERRFRVDDDVDGFVNEQLWSRAFAVHGYHHPTIGWMDDIQSFTPEDCLAFYRRHYAPNNATVVLVGDFDEPGALALLERHYGGLAEQPLPADGVVAEPEQEQERRAHFTKPVTTEKLAVGYKCPPLADPDHPALELAHEVLLGNKSSRLYRALVVDEVCSSASGWVASFKDPGLYELHATPKRGRTAAEALAVIDREIARLAEGEVAGDEIEKARAHLESAFLWDLRSSGGRAQTLGHFEVTTGDFRNLVAVPEAYRRVTPADVRRVAGDYLRPERRTIVTVEPA